MDSVALEPVHALTVTTLVDLLLGDEGPAKRWPISHAVRVHIDSPAMLRAVVLATVVTAFALGGCGGDASDEGGESRPAATVTATPASSEYYAAMEELLTRLDGAVAAAIAGEADAVKRIDDVVKDARKELREHRAAGGGESEAGNLVLTTAASARDYARNGEREGLKLVRRFPIVEARDELESEASP